MDNEYFDGQMPLEDILGNLRKILKTPEGYSTLEHARRIMGSASNFPLSRDQVGVLYDRSNSYADELRHYVECLCSESTISEPTKDKMLSLINSLDPASRSERNIDLESEHPITYLFDSVFEYIDEDD